MPDDSTPPRDQPPPRDAAPPGDGDGDVRARAVELAHRLLDQARDGDPALLPWVDRGVPVNLADPDGNTLLMLAAYHGHADLVRDLVERGGDVDRCNDRGQSPLAGAVFKGFEDVVRVLARNGADPDLGEPSARAAAAFFERPDLAAHFPSPPPSDGTGAPDTS